MTSGVLVLAATGFAQAASPDVAQSAASAVAFMKAQHDSGSRDWSHLCLSAVSQAWGGIDDRDTAAAAAEATTSRHHTTPPVGAPVWWPGVGSVGHVALSDGSGYVWSNDIVTDGSIDRVSIADLDAQWGDGSGDDWFWSDDLGGRTLPLDTSASGQEATSTNG